jgi:hypothetical protein
MKKIVLFIVLFYASSLLVFSQTDTTKKVTAVPDTSKKVTAPVTPKPEPVKPKESIIVSVQESNETITGKEPGCIKTTLFLDYKEVSNEWEDFLKKYDKKVYTPKGNKGTYLADVAKIPTISYLPMQVSSKVINNGGGSVTILWAIKLDSGYVTKAKHPSLQIAKDLLHDFGVKVYKDDINQQIKDSEKALSKLQNQYEKLVREGQSLVKDVERNKKEKIELEQKMVQNRQDSARFVTEIPNRLQEKELALSNFNIRKTQFDSLKASQMLGKATQDDIKKGQKDLNAVEKETNKKENAYDRALKDAEKNKTEKQTLIRKLYENKVELPKLYAEIEQNKKAQAQANEAVKKQQEAVEVVRERLYLIK